MSLLLASLKGLSTIFQVFVIENNIFWKCPVFVVKQTCQAIELHRLKVDVTSLKTFPGGSRAWQIL